MPSPVITFRLTPFQLARGLKIIRTVEPTYQLTSLSQMVKVIYTDYLAKMTLGQGDEIDQHILDEINSFIDPGKKKSISLDDIITKQSKPQPQPVTTESETGSSISSVSDFSPPEDWLNDEE